jgi:polar amino acid transport system ATP-binding protein
MTATMVRIEQVHKRFGAVHVLKGVSLTVHPGEVMCLLGPSGSGKSTLLRCINHLEAIDAGRIYVDDELVGYREHDGRLYELRDREICRKRSEIGMVFQSFNLFPHLNALENVVAAPVRVKGRSRAAARERGRELLARVGLGDRCDAYPRELSGGQQQRVAIARALMSQPTVLFADEPTGNLDSASTQEILDLLRRSVTEVGQTVVMVTHDPHAASIADRILFLADGEIVRELVGADEDQIVEAMKELGP